MRGGIFIFSLGNERNGLGKEQNSRTLTPLNIPLKIIQKIILIMVKIITLSIPYLFNNFFKQDKMRYILTTIDLLPSIRSVFFFNKSKWSMILIQQWFTQHKVC